MNTIVTVRTLHEADHAVQEGLAALGGDAHHDAVGEHLGAARHRRAVTAGLADDRGRLAGDRRLVDRGHTFGDLTVGGDDVVGLTHHQVALQQLGGGDHLLGAVGPQTPGLGLRAHLAQGVGLGLAAPFGHGFGEVGEDHGEEQPDGDRPVEDAGVRDGLDQGDDRSDEHDEHDRVLDLDPGVEFLEGADQRTAQDLGVE
jgi:hypothetical protein